MSSEYNAINATILDVRWRGPEEQVAENLKQLASVTVERDRLRAELTRWQRIARDRLRTLKAERKARGE